MNTFDHMSINELASFVADYYFNVYGYYPQVEGLFENRTHMSLLVEQLDQYMNGMKRTKSGRNQLRAKGWIINTPSAEEDGYKTHTNALQQTKTIKEYANYFLPVDEFLDGLCA